MTPPTLTTLALLLTAVPTAACNDVAKKTHDDATPTAASMPAAPSPPAAAAPKGGGPPAMQKLLEPGPEAARLARLAGTWDVVMTMRPAPDAEPVVARGMIAERAMMGLYLTETMKQAPGATAPEFKRVDYLTYDPVQARWEYASMDTRAPVGIMFARGVLAKEPGTSVTVYFDNFANPGIGDVGGAVRARHVDESDSDDHGTKRQYWIKPGVPEWLAVQYEYTRKK